MKVKLDKLKCVLTSESVLKGSLCSGPQSFGIIRNIRSKYEKMSSSCSCKNNNVSRVQSSSANVQEAESLVFEGGSDMFTSNRHELHNNEAKTFNMMTFRTQDDAPFFTSPQQQQYMSATIPVQRDGCERVTTLMKRSNFQWVKHAAALAGAGLLVFNAIHYYKTGKITMSKSSSE